MAGFVILIAFLSIVALYTLTLYNTLDVIAPINRAIRPGMVWLMMIPFFNLVWHFVIVHKIADSIAGEFRQRVGQSDFRPGYGTGMIASTAFFISVLISIAAPKNTPTDMIGGIFSIIGIICGITYWIQIHKYKRKIKQLPPYIADSAIFDHKKEGSI
jgi:hypothetical protein